MTDLNLASSDGNWANKFPEWEVRCKGCGNCLCTKLLYLKLLIEGNEVFPRKKMKRLREKNMEKSQAYRFFSHIDYCRIFNRVPCATQDQALSLWSGSKNSKALDYLRTNPREYKIVRTHAEETT